MWLNEWYKRTLGRPATGRWARPPAPRRHGLRPTVEQLEDRNLLSTFTVLNLNDSGPGSLRQAVLDANARPGSDAIAFAHGLSGPLSLTGGELPITDDLTIRGPGEGRLTVSGND